MLLRKLVVVGLVGFVSLAANIATAEDAGAPGVNFVGVDDANFVDPSDVFSGNRFDVSVNSGEAARFTNLSPSTQPVRRNDSDYRRYEVALTTRSASGIDVSFAQRAGLGFNRDGDIESESRGSEVRLGRLSGVRRDQPSGTPTWYFFAASEDEALTWRPGVRTDFGGSGSSFRMQDRVEIGDIQAGVTYERDGWQASLAYVEREVSVRTGSRTVSQDEDFAGFTLTMRH